MEENMNNQNQDQQEIKASSQTKQISPEPPKTAPKQISWVEYANIVKNSCVKALERNMCNQGNKAIAEKYMRECIEEIKKNNAKKSNLYIVEQAFAQLISSLEIAENGMLTIVEPAEPAPSETDTEEGAAV